MSRLGGCARLERFKAPVWVRVSVMAAMVSCERSDIYGRCTYPRTLLPSYHLPLESGLTGFAAVTEIRYPV